MFYLESLLVNNKKDEREQKMIIILSILVIIACFSAPFILIDKIIKKIEDLYAEFKSIKDFAYKKLAEEEKRGL